MRASRALRRSVAAGSMAYSPVTQPSPLPFKKSGTLSSTVAVQSTRVSPMWIITEASGFFR